MPKASAPTPPCAACWPASLEPTFEDVDLGIARSQPEMPGEPPVTEVEALFLDQIRAGYSFEGPALDLGAAVDAQQVAGPQDPLARDAVDDLLVDGGAQRVPVTRDELEVRDAAMVPDEGLGERVELTGGHPFARFDGDGEGRAHALAVLVRHRRQAQLPGLLRAEPWVRLLQQRAGAEQRQRRYLLSLSKDQSSQSPRRH